MNEIMLLSAQKAAEATEQGGDPSDLMEVFLLLIPTIMVLICVAMFIIGLVQKAKRKNDPLTKKTKLLEMYEAEERKKREEAEAKAKAEADKSKTNE